MVHAAIVRSKCLIRTCCGRSRFCKTAILSGVPIGIGGFGITYAAQNAESGERIAVKEYFPQGIALRNADGTVQVVDGYRQAFRHGLERFSMEASVLQTFANVSGIVRVDDSFSCNGTGYIVMEYLTGRTLKKDAEIMGESTLSQELPRCCVKQRVH